MIGIKLGLLLVFSVLAKCSVRNVQSKYHLSSRIDPGVRFILETNECAGVGYRIVRDNQIVFESTLGHFAPLSSAIDHGNKIILISNQDQIVLELVEDTPAIFLVDISRKNIKSDKSITDCVSLGRNSLHWYGGPQQKYQYWPVEKLTLPNYSYVTKEADNAAVAERYWVNTEGAFIHLSDTTPLFIDQNSMKDDHLCFIARQSLPYNPRHPTFDFEYSIGVARDAKAAHMEAVHRFLGRPSGVPDPLMAARPIWSTWARYKRDIDETVVMRFANEIVNNGFTNSQFEIDDDWEICYGALEFRTSKFPNIRNTVQQLKNMGFRVTLWIHPFINKGCEPYYTTAKDNGYLVKDHNGNVDTQWWNSEKGEAAYIDFTNPEAAAWYTGRLRKLLEDTGIDSYKFDAGESSWQPDDPILNSPLEEHPLSVTTDYIRTVAEFGPIVEVRSGFKNQYQDVYMRMIDKDSEWGWNNGLPTLVTTLLQLNMNGYPLVLPDMIGGNGYDNHMPDREMFIRWLQANVFMPSLQFSYVPWDYQDGDGIKMQELCKHFVKLHEDYADTIIRRFERAVSHGEPVNPPVWWLDPRDKNAQTAFDAFLLGEEILAAPILQKGQTSRNIYLPVGRWQDGNNGSIYHGRQWLNNYPAPLSVLPYFIRLP
ncbi:myogenesis-regulating glycosidase-like [Phlebotomus papatasi]|uniref:myogenesis-regulating glycosidase-like n=1 Tax=Phlebotomus papatasi TaxID=29031 RepID=UPI0024845099|nr:myogenesis-regulating glycosidase-like [Phlebotomus papatasi]